MLSIVGSDGSVAERVRLEHGEDAAGGGRPVVQQLTTVDAGGGFRLQLQSGRTRTVVIIDILLTTRAAMHTTIAAAADWQFEANLSEANCKRVRE